MGNGCDKKQRCIQKIHYGVANMEQLTEYNMCMPVDVVSEDQDGDKGYRITYPNGSTQWLCADDYYEQNMVHEVLYGDRMRMTAKIIRNKRFWKYNTSKDAMTFYYKGSTVASYKHNQRRDDGLSWEVLPRPKSTGNGVESLGVRRSYASKFFATEQEAKDYIEAIPNN